MSNNPGTPTRSSRIYTAELITYPPEFPFLSVRKWYRGPFSDYPLIPYFLLKRQICMQLRLGVHSGVGPVRIGPLDHDLKRLRCQRDRIYLFISLDRRIGLSGN